MTVSGGLLERDGVTGAVAGLVGAVGAGRPGALFVVGEAGLGKTSVLGLGRDLAAAAQLRAGFGRGHPMEGALPFGVLVQVLNAVGGQGLLREDQLGSAAGDDRALLAREVYLHRLRGEIAAMTAAMEGLDALVFTGGVGENSAEIRSRAAAGLGFLGVRVDAGRNESGTGDREIGSPGATVRSLVISAREDIEIARQVRSVLGW